MIVRRLVRALDRRLAFAPLARKALNKVFPDHWSFMLGELSLYSFLALVATGVFLTVYFEASEVETTYDGRYGPLHGAQVSAAYASAVKLSWDVKAGLLMRQAHHWAALVFVGAILAHLARIFFTGAFRRPRELNWLIGVTMLLLAILNGFTGYSMPDDLLSGTGLRIAYSVAQSIPVVGTWVAFLFFGGEFPASETVGRLYISHVLLVPVLLAGLIGLHLLILIRQKHAQFPGPGRTEHNVVGSRLWPGYAMRSAALLVATFGVVLALGGLVQINPVWLYGPFDPSQVSAPAQPDWYIGWGDGALRLFPPADVHLFGHLIPSQFWPGALLPGLSFVLLYLWPFLEAWLTRDRADHQLLDRPRDHPARLGIGVGALSFYLLLLVAAGSDLLARWADLPVTGVVMVLRFLVLGVPVLAGVLGWLLARALRRSDAAGLGGLSRTDLRAALRRTSRPGPSTPPPAERTVAGETEDAGAAGPAAGRPTESELEVAPEVRIP